MGLDGNSILRLTLAVGAICVTLLLTSDRNIFPLGKPWHWRCWNICFFFDDGWHASQHLSPTSWNSWRHGCAV